MLSRKTKPFVFVLMPFANSFDDVYQLGIKGACDKAGMYCERVDEQLYSERILDRIYNQIAKADVIIADMSGRNENVFYEVGYAHGLGKKVILLTDDAKDIPFDLKDYPHIVYNGRVVDLIKPLIKKLKWSITLPDTTNNVTACPIELFYKKTKLVLDEVTHIISSSSRDEFKISMHNLSALKLTKKQIRIGVTAKNIYENNIFNYHDSSSANSLRKVISQPDGTNLIVITFKDELYPDEWGVFEPFYFGMSESFEFTIKLFLPSGTFTFPVNVEIEKSNIDISLTDDEDIDF